MKTAFGLSLLAVLAVADVNITSSYSVKRVTEVKHHLEKVYGKGLVGMFDSHGKMTRERLSWARMRPRSIWMEYGGLEIDAETSSAWWYGFIGGMQYTGM
jgi:hypothetical protein